MNWELELNGAPTPRTDLPTWMPEGNMTLAERAQAKARDATANAGHCLGVDCDGPVAHTCACPCRPCAQRRATLTAAQAEVGMPMSRMPGEDEAAWAARFAET